MHLYNELLNFRLDSLFLAYHSRCQIISRRIVSYHCIVHLLHFVVQYIVVCFTLACYVILYHHHIMLYPSSVSSNTKIAQATILNNERSFLAENISSRPMTLNELSQASLPTFQCHKPFGPRASRWCCRFGGAVWTTALRRQPGSCSSKMQNFNSLCTNAPLVLSQGMLSLVDQTSSPHAHGGQKGLNPGMCA